MSPSTTINKKVKVVPVRKEEPLANGSVKVTLNITQPDGSLMIKTFIEKPKKRSPRPVGVAKNGLSIESIRAAGHKVSVHHYRAFTCSQLNRPKIKNHDNKDITFVDCDKKICLPKSVLKDNDPTLKLLSNGGYTRLHITILDQREFSAEELTRLSIPKEELLEYKLGVWKRIIKSFYVMSRCAESDHFCYKTAIKDALGRVLPSDVYEINNPEPVSVAEAV